MQIVYPVVGCCHTHNRTEFSQPGEHVTVSECERGHRNRKWMVYP